MVETTYSVQPKNYSHKIKELNQWFNTTTNMSRLRTFLGRYGLSPQDFEDILQETHTKAYQSLASFQQRSDIETWIYRIAINNTIDLKRKEKREKRVISDFALDLSCSPHKAYVPSIENSYIVREGLELTLQILALLKPKYREVIYLTAVIGMTYKDTAIYLGVSEGVMMSRLNYARKYLKSKMNSVLANNAQKKEQSQPNLDDLVNDNGSNKEEKSISAIPIISIPFEPSLTIKRQRKNPDFTIKNRRSYKSRLSPEEIGYIRLSHEKYGGNPFKASRRECYSDYIFRIVWEEAGLEIRRRNRKNLDGQRIAVNF